MKPIFFQDNLKGLRMFLFAAVTKKLTCSIIFAIFSITSNGRFIRLHELQPLYTKKIKKKSRRLLSAMFTFLTTITATAETEFDITKTLGEIRRQLKHCLFLTKHKHYK